MIGMAKKMVFIGMAKKMVFTFCSRRFNSFRFPRIGIGCDFNRNSNLPPKPCRIQYDTVL